MAQKKKLKERWQTWGWYSILFEIAESGLFLMPGKSAVASAQAANFYEAFIYLGKKSDYQNI